VKQHALASVARVIKMNTLPVDYEIPFLHEPRKINVEFVCSEAIQVLR
jgi:hypothetical protein